MRLALSARTNSAHSSRRYYNDSHRKVRSAIRKFTDEHLTPNALAWDEAKSIPADAYKRVADEGILAAIGAGGSGWLDELAVGIKVPGGIDPKQWDAFHSAFFESDLCARES